jgi:hypothetical protein
MTVVELAHLITKYNLEEKGYCLYYHHTNYIGDYGTSTRGVYINFHDFAIENVFNPIACDCKIKNMIKDFKEKAIKSKINEIEKDFENGT